MKNISPPLALTMGDASGIGPEIVAKVLAKGGERVVVFGSHVVMQDAVRRLGLNIEVRRIEAPDAALFQPQVIEVDRLHAQPARQIRWRLTVTEPVFHDRRRRADHTALAESQLGDQSPHQSRVLLAPAAVLEHVRAGGNHPVLFAPFQLNSQRIETRQLLQARQR